MTGKVKLPVVETPAESVTFTVKVEAVAVAGGVPLKTPAVLILSHVGRPVADHV